MSIQREVDIKYETLKYVLKNVFGTDILCADYQTKQLQGGTIGDVQLVTGTADIAGRGKVSYNVVLKIQKKFERHGDPYSWRREYDLYASDFQTVFSDSFRMPERYHTEMNGDEIHIWMEYIDGISGKDLSVEMLEQTAFELGRFQGRVQTKPDVMRNVACLSDPEFMEREFGQWHKQTFTYDFLISEQCRMPEFLKQMLKDDKIQLKYSGKSFEYNCLRSECFDLPEHLKRMLTDMDDQMETVFQNLKSLPVVLCHRDLWIENIFFSDGKIVLIDWDCAGWGYMGEDIASLIVDGYDEDIKCFLEYYHRFVSAYHKGLTEYMDISAVEKFYIQEMIIIKFGYRFFQKYMFTESPDVRAEQITALQQIYEMRK